MKKLFIFLAGLIFCFSILFLIPTFLYFLSLVLSFLGDLVTNYENLLSNYFEETFVSIVAGFTYLIFLSFLVIFLLFFWEYSTEQSK